MDKFSPEKRSEIMRRVRSKDTKPELIVRRLAHRMGYRFRLHSSNLPGSPDLVFPRFGSVVFVHGCFWHGHSCEAASLPSSRVEYWEAKRSRNKARDRKSARELRRLGWKVLTVWECQTRNPEKVARRLRRFLESA
jgi:DNA mismatch endonuclease (patch repair protein)